MVNQVNLSLYLICHHGEWDDFKRDARVVQRVSLEKGVPVTYFFSGIELKALAQNRYNIWNELWSDVVGGMQGGSFVNPRYGYDNPHLSEIGGTTFNHVPLVQPWFQNQREYLEGILPDQIQWTLDTARYDFGKIIVTFHPPDGVYAPAAAYKLKEHGLDTVVVSGEFLGWDTQAKGRLYWANGLRHLMRTNDLQPQSTHFWNAGHFVDAVEAYGHQNNTGFVVVGCDSDEFNGMNGMSLEDGVARLCCIGDEMYRRNGRVKMINCNAASYWNINEGGSIGNIWGWNDVHAMQNSEGDLRWMDAKKNDAVNLAVYWIGERNRQGWDVRAAKGHLNMAADIACRNGHWSVEFNKHFWDNMDAIKWLLQY